ncbi:hypothetical protein IFM89_014612 [Coptis chinensis]|uniref:Water stress and hypersensitive response domain-containing protein n=1 Tax=Coptis chinensis TaxID=261450 RepID=A0A835IR41_9MAGN|nr:hypothetical protein IFM89_014612 [Coptis chinensis]
MLAIRIRRASLVGVTQVLHNIVEKSIAYYGLMLHPQRRTWCDSETSLTLHLKLDNKNDFDLGLNAPLEYEVWLADVSIGTASLSKSAKIDKKGQGLIEIPISFRPKDFGSAMWEMIRGRGTGYSMKGNIDVDTPFGPMKLPISKEGGSTRLKKAEDDDDDEVSGCLEKTMTRSLRSCKGGCQAIGRTQR